MSVHVKVSSFHLKNYSWINVLNILNWPVTSKCRLVSVCSTSVWPYLIQHYARLTYFYSFYPLPRVLCLIPQLKTNIDVRCAVPFSSWFNYSLFWMAIKWVECVCDQKSWSMQRLRCLTTNEQRYSRLSTARHNYIEFSTLIFPQVRSVWAVDLNIFSMFYRVLLSSSLFHHS